MGFNNYYFKVLVDALCGKGSCLLVFQSPGGLFIFMSAGTISSFSTHNVPITFTRVYNFFLYSPMQIKSYKIIDLPAKYT